MILVLYSTIYSTDLLTPSVTSDLSQLTSVLEDVALAGVMGFVDLGSWMLDTLVSRLKSVVKQMTPLVTKEVYLPAPPLYCPQPPKVDQVRHSST